MNPSRKRSTGNRSGRRKVRVVGIDEKAYLLKNYGLIEAVEAYVGDLKLPDGRRAKAVRPKGKAFWRIAFIVGEWGDASQTPEEQ